MNFRFKLLSKKFVANLPEVTSSEIFSMRTRKRTYHPEGIFSEQIFGPVVDYKCQCGKYHGKEYHNKVCEICGVTIGPSSMRREIFAKISLPTKLFNPLIFEILQKAFSKKYYPDIYSLKFILFNTSHARYFVFDKEKMIIEKVDVDNIEDTFNQMEYDEEHVIIDSGISFLSKVIAFLKDKDEKIKDFMDKFGDVLYIEDVVVTPPELRPIVSIGDNKFNVDGENLLYLSIIKQKQILEQTLFEDVRVGNYAKLQNYIFELYDVMIKKFSMKTGIIRQHILGKRTDYSGRAVIVPNPDLDLYHVDIPYEVAKKVFTPHLLMDFSQKTNISPYEVVSKDLISDENYADIVLELLNKKYKDSYIVINRQPTLHRPSIQGFKINRFLKDYVLAIHPLTTTMANSDYDGDSLAMYFPFIEESIQDVANRMLVDSFAFLPSNRAFGLVFKHEIVLGFIEVLKHNRDALLKVLPEELHDKLDPDKLTNDKQINKFLVEIFKLKNKTINEKMEILDKVYHLSINEVYATIRLSDFYIQGLEPPEERFKNNYNEEKALEKYKEEIKQGRHSYAYDIITSGARGNWGQFKQIAIGKGYIADVFGNIIPEPVKHSLLEGLTQEEYFLSAFGSRKGIVDTAANTAKSGYQTRKLVFLLSPVKLHPTMEDCGTEKVLEIYVKNEKLAESLVGRYTEDGVKITTNSYKDLVGKTVKVRSPIYCKAPNNQICHRCYGDLYKLHKSKQIGIIAAQSMGERMTQLVLRTFHFGGIANRKVLELPKHIFSHKDSKVYTKKKGQIKYPKDLEIIIFEFEGGERHKLGNFAKFFLPLVKSGYVFNPGEEIMKVVDTKNKDIIADLDIIGTLLSLKSGLLAPSEFIEILFDTFIPYGRIDLVHLELLASALLFDNKLNGFYRYSESEKYTWVSLMKAIELIGSQIHNISFERFKQKLISILSSEEHKDSTFAFVEELFTFWFKDEPLKIEDDDITDIITA